MQPEDLELFGRNCGDLYDKQCNWARNGAPLSKWQQHVRMELLPRYRREEHEPYEGLSLAALEAVAKELKRHYERLVKEIDTQ